MRARTISAVVLALTSGWAQAQVVLDGHADAPPASQAEIPDSTVAASMLEIASMACFGPCPEASGMIMHMSTVLPETMPQPNALTLLVGVTASLPWHLLQVSHATVISAMTATGEMLPSVTDAIPMQIQGRWDSPSQIFNKSPAWFRKEGGVGVPDEVLHPELTLQLPQHPATSIKRLEVTMQVVLGADGSCQARQVDLVPGQAVTIPVPGADMTVTSTPEGIEARYGPAALLSICSWHFLDKDGTSWAFPPEYSQATLNRQVLSTFPTRGHVFSAVSVQVYTEIRHLEARMVFTSLPLGMRAGAGAGARNSGAQATVVLRDTDRPQPTLDGHRAPPGTGPAASGL